MERQGVFLTFLLCLCICLNAGISVYAEGLRDKHRPTKLFVFGDSYADTGNTNRTISDAWKVPYGMSFPGRPGGRWSNGFVLTDYIAKFMRIRTPVAFRSWRKHGLKKSKYGINFAYGGTGVFNIPGVSYPNMTQQIDLFQQILQNNVYSTSDIQNSIVLVTLSGNDYAAYLAQHPTDFAKGIIGFISQVVPQLVSNVRRIYGMGVKQVLVANLQPLGCLPRVLQAENSTQCDELDNTAANYHNGLLQAAINELNNGAHVSDYQPFILLDLFSAFSSVFTHNGVPSGDVGFKNPLEACCLGINEGSHCASVDESNGRKMYRLCEDPKMTFFWDGAHPTHEGWRAITVILQDTLRNIHDI